MTRAQRVKPPGEHLAASFIVPTTGGNVTPRREPSALTPHNTGLVPRAGLRTPLGLVTASW